MGEASICSDLVTQRTQLPEPTGRTSSSWMRSFKVTLMNEWLALLAYSLRGADLG